MEHTVSLVLLPLEGTSGIEWAGIGTRCSPLVLLSTHLNNQLPHTLNRVLII